MRRVAERLEAQRGGSGGTARAWKPMAVPKDMFAKRPSAVGIQGVGGIGRAGIFLVAGVALGFGLAKVVA